MDKIQVALGMSQTVEQEPHPLQAGPDAGGADRLQPGDRILPLQR
jgi:hypothetical protein